jgi:hypothetical protein
MNRARWTAGLLVLFVGCGGPPTPIPRADTGPVDAAVSDAGSSDAGSNDAGSNDAGDSIDGGPIAGDAGNR